LYLYIDLNRSLRRCPAFCTAVSANEQRGSAFSSFCVNFWQLQIYSQNKRHLLYSRAAPFYVVRTNVTQTPYPPPLPRTWPAVIEYTPLDTGWSRAAQPGNFRLSGTRSSIRKTTVCR